MKIQELGFVGKITKLIAPGALENFELARVIIEHKERYIVQSTQGTYSAEITGNLRFSAESRADFPAVGDWVKMVTMDEETAIILEVLPRVSVLERQAVGKYGEVQIIASNVDYAFIVQAVGHDFNLKRIERYLTICHASGIVPIIVLTKIDLSEEEEVEQLLQQIKERVRGVEVFALSNTTEEGLEQFKNKMEAYKSYCFLGSSGVGKSTLVNHLKGEEVLKTSAISSSTNKGRHTTSHRELIILPNGSIVIDTPGMREVGITGQAQSVETTYDEIVVLSDACKFKDCSHNNELGCAVLAAVEEGQISEEAYENYQRLRREQARFSASLRERRKKDRAQGKLYKAIQRERRKNKY